MNFITSMISKKRLLPLLFVPLAVFFLSGCSKQDQQPKTTTPNKATQNSDINSPNPALQNSEQPQDQSNASTQLEPLPADDKQAIDTELDNIDKDIKSTDNTIKSDDLSNANLGL